jgi:nitric oxide reductase activation protein
MSASPAVILLTAITAGAAAGFGSATLASSGSPAATENAGSLAVDSMRKEVARLGDENANLLRLLQTLEMRLDAAPTGGAPGRNAEPLAMAAPELVQLQQQVAQLNERLGDDEQAVEPMAMQTVSAALEKIRADEDEQRREERREARKEREVERVDELAEELALDGYQKSRMGELVAQYGDSSDTIIESARKTGDWGGIRSAFDELHGQIGESLDTVLTPTQLTELEGLGGTRALSSSGWGGWGTRRSSSSDESNG